MAVREKDVITKWTSTPLYPIDGKCNLIVRTIQKNEHNLKTRTMKICSSAQESPFTIITSVDLLKYDDKLEQKILAIVYFIRIQETI